MSIFCGGGIARRSVDTNLTRGDKKILKKFKKNFNWNVCLPSGQVLVTGGGTAIYISISAIIYSRVLGDTFLMTKHWFEKKRRILELFKAYR